MLSNKSDIRSLFHASHPVTKVTWETFLLSIWELIEMALFKLLAVGLLDVGDYLFISPSTRKCKS